MELVPTHWATTAKVAPAPEVAPGPAEEPPPAPKYGLSQLISFAALALANVLCQAIFSVLPAFYPQVARRKGMSELTIGVSFAMLPAVVFMVSTLADRILGVYGRRRVFIVGNVIVASATGLLGAAIFMPDGLAFVTFCLTVQAVQGFGTCLAEAASFALISELFPDSVTFFLGLNEACTGIGVAIGPPIGGVLYSVGGFSLPFVALAMGLLPGVAFVAWALGQKGASSDGDEEAEDEDDDEPSSLLSVLSIRQVLVVAIACVLSESALTFIMPTFADHATAEGLASSPAAIGGYFAANAIAYTLAAPLVGLVTGRGNARTFILTGMLLIALPAFFLGPSPLVQPLLTSAASPLRLLPVTAIVLGAFALLGVGEGLAMAPLMEDMMASCGERAPEYVDALSALMTGSYALGEVLGPISGSALSSLLGFEWATTVLATVLLVYVAFLWLVSFHPPPPPPQPTSTEDASEIRVPILPVAVASAQADASAPSATSHRQQLSFRPSSYRHRSVVKQLRSRRNLGAAPPPASWRGPSLLASVTESEAEGGANHGAGTSISNNMKPSGISTRTQRRTRSHE